MNIFADFTARIHALVPAAGLTAADGSPLDLSRVLVEPPREAAHGDLATNAAMVLSKAAGKPPRQLAET
ncbi:arginine--tRNA ligase, partial [Mycobacterium tuberculosis]|nr:arginine--tRNA ligase [Mycobacterium tuberculosis]